MDVADKTQYADENGKALKLSDFRTGDTMYIVSHKQQDGSLIADKVTEGMMTIAEMRRRYVPYLPALPEFATGMGSPNEGHFSASAVIFTKSS